MDEAQYPIKNKTLRHHAVKNDLCPECGAELDTGWECLRCGFDARPIVHGEGVTNG